MALKRLRPAAGVASVRSVPRVETLPEPPPERLLAAVRAVLALTDAGVAFALGRPSIALLLLMPLAVSAFTLAALRRDLPARSLERVGAAAMGADLVVLVVLSLSIGAHWELGGAADLAGGQAGAALAGAWLTRFFLLIEGPLRHGWAGAALTAVPATVLPLLGMPAALTEPAVAGARVALTVVPALTAAAVVTSLRRAAAQARGLRTRLEQAFAHAPIGLAVLDLYGDVLHANTSLADLVGTSTEALQGSSFVALVRPSMRAELRRALADLRAAASSGHRREWCAELPLGLDDGTAIWALVGVSLVRDPLSDTPQRLVVHVSDVSDQRALQQALEYEATHDRLTGLPGRQLFVQRLSEALEDADPAAEDGLIAVLFCDLDGFKEVNDRFGHTRGDQLLAITARRLAGALRLPALAARWGGDEFVVLCDAQNLEEAQAIARRLVTAVSQPIAEEHVATRISMSVGIAMPAPGERDPYHVIDTADAAMYRAKQLGPGGWVVSDSGEALHVPAT